MSIISGSNDVGNSPYISSAYYKIIVCSLACPERIILYAKAVDIYSRKGAKPAKDIDCL